MWSGHGSRTVSCSLLKLVLHDLSKLDRLYRIAAFTARPVHESEIAASEDVRRRNLTAVLG